MCCIIATVLACLLAALLSGNFTGDQIAASMYSATVPPPVYLNEASVPYREMHRVCFLTRDDCICKRSIIMRVCETREICIYMFNNLECRRNIIKEKLEMGDYHPYIRDLMEEYSEETFSILGSVDTVGLVSIYHAPVDDVRVFFASIGGDLETEFDDFVMGVLVLARDDKASPQLPICSKDNAVVVDEKYGVWLREVIVPMCKTS